MAYVALHVGKSFRSSELWAGRESSEAMTQYMNHVELLGAHLIPTEYAVDRQEVSRVVIFLCTIKMTS